ncbi:MAG: RluA family pseudouridine synthase [Fulvivirga sp.]|nr:RluA family pseudouridine synthase [Fulvivirga sp.]
MRLSLIEKRSTIKSYQLDLEVFYEDNYLAVVHKPAGMITSGNQFKTLANALNYNLYPSEAPDRYTTPRPVHRLDRATSGLVVIAKTRKTGQLLGQMLEERKIEKTYMSVVLGFVEKPGKINIPIDKKPAITHFQPISSKKQLYTLLKLSPLTGRTHQLRIHCAAHGFPIVGDQLYGRAGGPSKGLFLSATALKFKHPILNKPVEVSTDVPKKFKKLMKA